MDRLNLDGPFTFEAGYSAEDACLRTIQRLGVEETRAELATRGVSGWDLDSEQEARIKAKQLLPDWPRLRDRLHWAKCGGVAAAIRECIWYLEGYRDGWADKG